MKINNQPWRIPSDIALRNADLQTFFPNAPKGLSGQSKAILIGGRQQALIKLANIDVIHYGKTRNFLNGHVTQLSPYLRHGCITLVEAVEFVQQNFGKNAEKLLYEFAWREYWRTVWYFFGLKIFQAMQTPKVALSNLPMPEDVLAGNTNLPCIDHFIHKLADTGYLHNHARMWLAAYLIHWRKTDWLAAATWMHDQLQDGDYASNHLSWQWVASTFSSKPYFFNQENLAKYSHGQLCQGCKAICPFNASYEQLETKLFKAVEQNTAQQYDDSGLNQVNLINKMQINKTNRNQTIIWFHDEMLSPEHPLLKLPEEKYFIFDTEDYKNWSTLRLQFIVDCLAQMPEVKVWVGNTQEIFECLNAGNIITQQTPNHLIHEKIYGINVEWFADEKVCNATFNQASISSFSRFWKVAAKDFLANF